MNGFSSLLALYPALTVTDSVQVGRGDSSNDQAVEQDPTGDEGPEKAMAGVVDNTAANGE